MAIQFYECAIQPNDQNHGIVAMRCSVSRFTFLIELQWREAQTRDQGDQNPFTWSYWPVSQDEGFSEALNNAMYPKYGQS